MQYAHKNITESEISHKWSLPQRDMKRQIFCKRENSATRLTRRVNRDIFSKKWVIVYRPTSIASHRLFRDLDFVTGSFINAATSRRERGDMYAMRVEQRFYYFAVSFASHLAPLQQSARYVASRQARLTTTRSSLLFSRSAGVASASSKLNNTKIPRNAFVNVRKNTM